MNRQQRRQSKSNQKDPTYNLKMEVLKEIVAKEARQQLVVQEKQYVMDMDTAVLWVLHTKYGFGEKRLKQFYSDLFDEHLRMRQYYDMDDLYPERYKLKEIGVDIEQMYNEKFDDQGNYKERGNAL